MQQGQNQGVTVASSEMVDTTMYHQMICSLMYLTDTRSDICFAVNTLRHVHLIVAKHAVRYLKGTVEYGIKYDMNMKTNLEALMWIRIGQAVSLIGRELLGVAGSSPAWK